MLDENLPTFHSKPSSDNPLNTILYFTHNGSDPAPYYLIMRADPSLPASKNKYAAAITDVSSQSIIYAEVLVSPEWTQPTLSAAEIRSQNGVAAPPMPIVPESVTVQLYHPDSQITLKQIAGSWGKSDTWEFEMPEQSFRMPSVSKVDQEDEPVVSDIVPKVVFKWKRDGRLSKDMTCYMVGKNVGGKKSKEPDITVALFKQGKNESAVTIYEPNMRRVEVEDRKGLDIILLLGAEVIRELYLNPKTDPFNISGAPVAMNNGRRKNSRPQTTSPGPGGPVMSGAVDIRKTPSPPAQANNIAPRPDPRRQMEIDNETRRLQAMVAEEERQAKEQERRDREEAKRLKKLMEQEEKERRRREAEIEKETERLRKQYGVQGQSFGAPSNNSQPPLPPRPGQQQMLSPVQAQGGWSGQAPPQPPRPSSAGPFHNQAQNSWWRGPPSQQPHFAPPPSQPFQQQAPQPVQGQGRGRRTGLLQGPYANPAASVSNFFHRDRVEDDRRKVQKKRSVHF